MKIMHRTIAVVSVALVLTTGCVAPNGTPDNTGTGALMGGAFGAIVGAVADRAHPGAGALIGGAVGLIAGGLVGHMIDQQQQQRLQQQYPQTWNKLQNNDAVYANSPPPSPPTPATSPEATAPTPATVPPTSTSTPATSSTPVATASQMQQFTVDDIKALTAAGVKPDAINKEIDISQSKFSQSDIAAAQQANVNSEVIAHMQSHSS
jgi:phage tail tape-measure protein